MGREKKITVKPLLNQEVKGRQESPLDRPEYPLYLEITYDRKYTKFPFGERRFPLSDYNKIAESESVKSAMEAVRKIVRYEVERDPEFTIKGIAKTIKSYLSPLQSCLLMLLLTHIGIELRKHVKVSELDYWNSLEPGKRVPEGIKILGPDPHFLIHDLLSTFQLVTIAGFDETILTWLLYTKFEDKVKLVERSIIPTALETAPYKELGGLRLAVKKMSAKDLVLAVDKMANLITDNQVSMSIHFFQS